MNYVDVFLALVLLLAMWGGWQKGFILGLTDLLLLAGSIASAIYWYPRAEVILLRWFPQVAAWSRPLAFLAVFALARLLLSALTNLGLNYMSPSVHRHPQNRLLGTLPGFINGLLYGAIFSVLLLAVPLNEQLTENTRNSRFAPKLALQAEWLEDKISPVFNGPVKRSINNTTVEPGSPKSIDLQFTVENTKPRPDLELQMLTLINAERIERKLRALVADPSLVPAARAHSADMFARGYFSHQTPEGLSPADRVKKYKVRYLVLGENLALGPTLSICHRGLMNSPGHKANILSKAYGRVGIGIVDGGVHGLMVTQAFRN